MPYLKHISKSCPASETLLALLTKSHSISTLHQIHALLFTLDLSNHRPLITKLLSLTSLSPSSTYVNYSHKILLHLPHPSTFHCNTVIRGYSNSKNPNGSLSVFTWMLRDGLIEPDYLTYPFVVKACARTLEIRVGGSVHGRILRCGFVLDRFVSNCLIHMYGASGDLVCAHMVFDEIPVKNLVSWNSIVDGYAKSGEMGLAREVFDEMPERDVVSWSCLIDGYVKSGEYGDALVVFEKMCSMGVEANEVTMVSLLCACAHLGALDKGRMMHRFVVENGLKLTLILRTSLVDMYAKCGAIEEAMHVFRGGPLVKSDVLIWNAMIGGLATHGLIEESLDLFSEMQVVGIRPDEITYLCLLSACVHGGLVKESWYFFDCIGKYGMTPKSEHYACMVDVMARAGQVAEAYQFLCEMPIEPTAAMLGALLNGCMNHGKLDLAEIVGRKLIELEPDHDGRYVGLSNAYAAVKCWEEARNMRQAMEMRGVKKSPGYSFVEMAGALQRFIAHDKSHPDSEKLYAMLNFVVSQMILDVDNRNQDYSFHDLGGLECKT